MATAADDQTADISKEYGQFVALVPINIGEARAFAPGDPVPASTVAVHKDWLEAKLVARAGTKAAAAAEPDSA